MMSLDNPLPTTAILCSVLWLTIIGLASTLWCLTDLLIYIVVRI